jgi:hypothetical protein
MNYKILVTEENRLAIKDIAERNGMDEQREFSFTFGLYMIIENDKIRNFAKQANFQELTFEQFKEMFDKAKVCDNCKKPKQTNNLEDCICGNGNIWIDSVEVEEKLMDAKELATIFMKHINSELENEIAKEGYVEPFHKSVRGNYLVSKLQKHDTNVEQDAVPSTSIQQTKQP